MKTKTKIEQEVFGRVGYHKYRRHAVKKAISLTIDKTLQQVEKLIDDLKPHKFPKNCECDRCYILGRLKTKLKKLNIQEVKKDGKTLSNLPSGATKDAD